MLLARFLIATTDNKEIKTINKPYSTRSCPSSCQSRFIFIMFMILSFVLVNPGDTNAGLSLCTPETKALPACQSLTNMDLLPFPPPQAPQTVTVCVHYSAGRPVW